MTHTRRPFRLSDALVLVVALALSLTSIKSLDAFIGGFFQYVDWDELFDGTANRDNRIISWSWLVWSFLWIAVLATAPCSIALLGLRLTPPRPPLRRVWRQPGAVAGLVVLVVFVFKAVAFATQVIIGRASGFEWHYVDADVTIPHMAGAMILGLWVVLWLGKLGRMEKSWVDRAGRAIGGLMILVFLIDWFVLGALNSATPRETPFTWATPTPSVPPPPASRAPYIPDVLSPDGAPETPVAPGADRSNARSPFDPSPRPSPDEGSELPSGKSGRP